MTGGLSSVSKKLNPDLHEISETKRNLGNKAEILHSMKSEVA